LDFDFIHQFDEWKSPAQKVQRNHAKSEVFQGYQAS